MISICSFFKNLLVEPVSKELKDAISNIGSPPAKPPRNLTGELEAIPQVKNTNYVAPPPPPKHVIYDKILPRNQVVYDKILPENNDDDDDNNNNSNAQSKTEKLKFEHPPARPPPKPPIYDRVPENLMDFVDNNNNNTNNNNIYDKLNPVTNSHLLNEKTTDNNEIDEYNRNEYSNVVVYNTELGPAVDRNDSDNNNNNYEPVAFQPHQYGMLPKLENENENQNDSENSEEHIDLILSKSKFWIFYKTTFLNI